METQLQAECKLCTRADDDESMLLCDGCNSGYVVLPMGVLPGTTVEQHVHLLG
jgi:hypothetical protein